MSQPTPGSQIRVIFPDGETVDGVVKFATDRGVYYTDGCSFCRDGLHHRVGMCGSRIVE
jgi:hypothetical protein